MADLMTVVPWNSRIGKLPAEACNTTLRHTDHTEEVLSGGVAHFGGCTRRKR